MKQERLMNAMGELDDVLIESAAPRGRRKARTLWARIGAAAACFALGFGLCFLTSPWLTVQADDVSYTDNVPEIILAEDLDAVFEIIELHPDVSENQAKRLRAFFERVELTETMTEKGREVRIRKYPIVEHAPIYVLEVTITEMERNWVDVMLQFYGGYTAERLEADIAHINQVAAEHGLEPIEYSSQK